MHGATAVVAALVEIPAPFRARFPGVEVSVLPGSLSRRAAQGNEAASPADVVDQRTSVDPSASVPG